MNNLLDTVGVSGCRMGEIFHFSVKFFIRPNYTKKLENTYNKRCLILKTSLQNKDVTIGSFLLKKGFSKLQRKRILPAQSIFNRNTDFSFTQETKFLGRIYSRFFLKTWRTVSYRQHWVTLLRKKIVLARCFLELLPSLILLTLSNFYYVAFLLFKIVVLTFSKDWPFKYCGYKLALFVNLKLLSCKLKKHWYMITYVFQLFMILQQFTREICYFLKK